MFVRRLNSLVGGCETTGRENRPTESLYVVCRQAEFHVRLVCYVTQQFLVGFFGPLLRQAVEFVHGDPCCLGFVDGFGENSV